MIVLSSDHNNDGFVSEKEFAALPPGEVDAGWRDSDKVWQEERKNEFRNVIDLDRDGKVTRDELKVKTHLKQEFLPHLLLQTK